MEIDMSAEIIYEGFEELEAAGYNSEYVEIKHFEDGRPSIMRPAFDLASCQSVGGGSGAKMRFLNHNGYDGERERALAQFGTEQVLIVKNCSVSRPSSTYEFEGFTGRWNTVMFEEVIDNA